MSGYLKEKNVYPRNMKISVLSNCSLNYKGLNCALTQWGKVLVVRKTRLPQKALDPVRNLKSIRF